MTTKISIIVLIICTYSLGYSQIEQTAKDMAEGEYQKFVNEIPNALAKGRTNIFGFASTKNQFLLEDDLNTFSEFLGWNAKKYKNITLNNVFVALSEKTKSFRTNPYPVTVSFDFQDIPDETVVSVRTNSKGTTADYMVTTWSKVTVEASKEGVQPSIASNYVALNWEGKLNIVNGEVDYQKKITPPVLRSIQITKLPDSPVVASEPVRLPESEARQLQAKAKDLIEKYYNQLTSSVGLNAVLAPEISNKDELEQWLQNSTRIEVASGNVNVPLPDQAQFIEVRNVPGVTIHVDPAPYMTETSSLYASKTAYHQLSLIFTVDLQNEKISKIEFSDNFVRPYLSPRIEKPVEPITTIANNKSVPNTQQQGLNYKIQILALDIYKPVSELPSEFRLEDILVEQYASGYKYIVPAGKTIREAKAKQNQLAEKGLKQTWIAVYENEARISPSEGKPLRIFE